MASADYRLCDVCGGKAFYDASLNYESAGENDPESYAVAGARAKWGSKLDSLGDWAVICRSCAEQHRTCLIGPCVSVDPEAPAEHPDATLRERLGALADALEAEAAPPGRSYIDTKSRGPHREGYEDALDACAQRVRALLRTEGQPQHPNPHCPHRLECLCDESEEK